MTTKKVYNLIILDESGSMAVIKNPTIDGVNALIETIKCIEKQYPEQEHFISFVTFNGAGISTHFDNQPVSNLTLIDQGSYQPNSMTPLYDAIGINVLKLRRELEGVNNIHVLVTIITDGEENSSNEFSGQQIRKIIDEQIARGWVFTYIGANQDVEKVAKQISIRNTMKFATNSKDINRMFSNEKSARQRFSEKIRNKEELQIDFYK